MKDWTPSPGDVLLPERLEQQFKHLEKRLWRVETGHASAGILAALLFSALLVFVADRLGESASWFRLLCLLGGIAGLGWFGFAWARHWIIKKRDKRALAIFLQKKFRNLGDRLLGVVELADEKKHPANFSPELYQAAVRQVAKEAESYDFPSSVATDRTRKLSFIALAAAGIVAAGFVVFPAAMVNSLKRWAAPLAAIPRYTLVRLNDLPKELVVPHGEPFNLSLPVSYTSFWRPVAVTWQFEDQPSFRTRVDQNVAQARVTSQTQPGLLKIKLGDVIAKIRVLPTQRPALKDMLAHIELPAYLDQKAVDEAVKNGTLSVLEGSRLKLQASTTRALSEARLKTPAGADESLTVQSNTFLVARTNNFAPEQLVFGWKDSFGLSNASPWKLALQIQKDNAPLAEFPDQPREVAVLQTEVIPLKAGGRDDFGVRNFGLLWEVASDWQKTNDIDGQKLVSQAETSNSKRLEQTFSFSPALYDIPADTTVELRAFATDYFPDRQPSESGVYRIHILGNEKHAEMVRQRLESLLVRLEEVARLEEKIVANTKDLEAKETPSAKNITETKDQQNQNAQDLNQMAQEGAKTLREAVRNPLFPEETIRDWAKTMQSMKDLASSSMKEASQSLQAAASNPKSGKENLQKAVTKEEEALQKLQSMQKKVNQNLDKLQALTLAQRLRKVGGREKELQAQIQKTINDSIGLLPQELPPSIRQSNVAVAEHQGGLQKESQGLQAEISRFFERTQKENYGKVSKEMTEARTDEELEKIRTQITQNIAMESMQKLDQWSKKFGDWADVLEPKQQESKGGGSGSGSGDDKAMKELMALLRMRESQMNLREQTRLLDKEKPASYDEKAKGLKETQGQIAQSLATVMEQNGFRFLDKPLGEAAESMDKTSELLAQPRTDSVTDKTHNGTVNLLTDAINLINEQAQRSSSSSEPGQEEMDFLMQMMAMGQQGQGMQTGASAGGSTAGGTTSQAAAPGAGDTKGKGADTRRTNKSSGASGSYPAEFKQALEGYFKALENN